MQANSKENIYKIIYEESFTFKNSPIKRKSREFNLLVTLVEPNVFKVTYSKPLTSCLSIFMDQNINNLALLKKRISFNYSIKKRGISIIDKDEPLELLDNLIQLIPEDSNVQYLLDNHDELEKELLREIELLHEYDKTNIPIGINHIEEDSSEKSDIRLFSDAEKEFIEKVNWKNLKNLELIKTSKEDNQLILLDKLKCNSLIGEETDYKEIVNLFFHGDLDINKFKIVSLNRDQRRFQFESNNLKELVKEINISSSIMHKTSLIKIEHQN